MKVERYRALVVDDEDVARRMLEFALTKEGFDCEVAADGEEGLARLRKSSFDLVVTDLRMPNKNGHALAVELLTWPKRPAIAVHTGVLEPRLAKDLMNRGVDDIVFKPTDYASFAAKMSALVERRRTIHEQAEGESAPSDKELADTDDEKLPIPPLPAKINIDKELASVLRELPLSPHALSVYRLTLKDDTESREIADYIKREPSLAAELLRLGNSTHYNPSGKQISDLTQIVNRIGRRRVGELALAAGACAVLKDLQLPVMDVELAWRRSVAAGVAAQVLADQSRHDSSNDGLVLGAVMHLLGRVGLCATYPHDYSVVLTVATQAGEALVDCERNVFGASQAEVMAKLLNEWNIPREIAWPLGQVELPYGELIKLNPSRRRQVELIKLAVLIGWLAVEKWEPWDLVEFPPQPAIERLGVESVRDVLEFTREELARLFPELRSTNETLASEVARVGYVRLANRGFDYLAELLPSMGLEPVYSELESQPSLIVNAIGGSQTNVQFTCDARRAIFIRDAASESSDSWTDQVALPSNYGCLCAILAASARTVMAASGAQG